MNYDEMLENDPALAELAHQAYVTRQAADDAERQCERGFISAVEQRALFEAEAQAMAALRAACPGDNTDALALMYRRGGCGTQYWNYLRGIVAPLAVAS